MRNNLANKVYIAGHQGMVGSAIVRELRRKGYTNLVYRTHSDLDLTNQIHVKNFFEIEKPNEVYLAAAKVGGIYANNTYPAQFIYENLMIQNNVIHEAFMSGVRKLLFLGSSCIYPKLASQPIVESSLLSGKLEPTNEPYAIAKITGIKMCESYNRQYGLTHGIDYRSLMPTNLFGPGDNYHPKNSHVIPALLLRIHEAKMNEASEVVIWGTGTPRREFLYVDDMAKASVFLMELENDLYQRYTEPMSSHINVGSGIDITINKLVKLIVSTVGFKGKIVFDCEKPDGTNRKLLDSSRLKNLGWTPKVSLEEGLLKTYQDFIINRDK
jgi:GDP-L-fucose synthase